MFTATDIGNFLACRHLATLERQAGAGKINRPFFSDPSLDLLLRLGIRHEQQYLRRLKEEPGADVAEIPADMPWRRAVLKTAEAMREGAAVIYQAALQHADWGGRADFLVRVDRPSALGFWSYEAVETKLARSTKGPALVQLCLYSELLAKIQDLEPEQMRLQLGGRTELETFRFKRFSAYFRRVRREFEDAYQAAAPTYPEPNEHCKVCSWSTRCQAVWRSDDHLCLVAGITRSQRRALVDQGVKTMAGLADLALPAQPGIPRIGEAALENIHQQARMQVAGREQAKPIYELLEPAGDGLGLAALPPPSAGDMFFDFEGAPYAFDEGLEYLFGIVTLSEEAGPAEQGAVGEASAPAPIYRAAWAVDRAEEKRVFEQFIADVMERWSRHPDMHTYHYAHYEPTAIKRLAGRHATCVDEVDRLLRAGIFVDLYRIVRQSLRASVESYSIKKLEPLYCFYRSTDLDAANLALKAFEALLAFGPEHDPEEESRLRTAIQGYNCDDCISTYRLRDWLEELRRELESKTGQPVPRPAMGSGDPSEGVAGQLERTGTIYARLVSDLPADETEWTEEQKARWLLAQMLEWHRREDKSTWWEYFRLCGLSDQELQEDKNALGGIVYAGEAGREKRSIIYRYKFALQNHTIDRANGVHDPRTRSGAGQVAAIDDLNGMIDMKRAATSAAPHPTSLIPYDIVVTQVLSDSLLRLATYVAERGIEGPGPFRAARDLLLRRPPHLREGLLQSVIGDCREHVEAAKRAVLGLEDSVLAIQGPPGAGKTFVGAQVVLALVNRGKRVGITAVSHKVISKILDDICAAADEVGMPLRAIQKIGDDGSGIGRGSDGSAIRIEPGVRGPEQVLSERAGDIEPESPGSAGILVESDRADREPNKTHPRVTRVKTNSAVVDAIEQGVEVVAGTAWLWSRDEMAGAVDVLFVDEAGQMSLANVLAVSQAANGLVLLGDPQQLDQPLKGIHPPGAELSAMSHILNGEATIGSALGLFLAETWRLHPAICEFTSEVFYQSRLRPRPENINQRLNTLGPMDGTGLRFIPVDHVGNQSESPEEAERVAELVRALLRDRSTWTNRSGETTPLMLQDILIVSPYNAQVSALAHKLPGAKVGTVDKFQGQQAPVVIYSMTTSTPEDAPRGMEFLYSANRLNVAVSRAQCVAVIVASPALFQVQCKTPRQMELANAFCRYLELARSGC